MQNTISSGTELPKASKCSQTKQRINLLVNDIHKVRRAALRPMRRIVSYLVTMSGLKLFDERRILDLI
jgi:hypothetical protein